MANEWDEIRNAKSEWLDAPYMGKCKIIGAFRSENETTKDGAKYTGRPYYKVVIECSNGAKHNHFMWRGQASDTAEKRQKMAAGIRRDLISFGVDIDNEADPLKALVGKHFLGAFGSEEYIGKEKGGRPTMKSSIRLFYINQPNKPFGPAVTLGSLNRTLRPEDEQKLLGQQQIWDQARSGVSSTTAVAPDDFPEPAIITPKVNEQTPAAPPIDTAGALEGPDDLPW